MSKLFKIGIALVLIGLASVLAITISGNSDVLGFNDENYTFYDVSFEKDQFNAIDFDFDNRRVYILESSDNQVHLSYYTHERDDKAFDDTGDSLSLSITRKWYYNLLSFDFFADRDYFEVYLYLPLGSSIDNIDVKSSNGKLNIDTPFTFDRVRLSTSNGDIDIRNIQANTLNANTSNGDIALDTLSVVNKVNLDTSNGKVLLNQVVADEIDAQTSNGRIYAENITCPDIKLDTSNGRIYLSIIGDKDDYAVTLSTSNGDQIYDGLDVASENINPSGTKEAVLDSSNGDVEIEFLDE